MGKFAKSLKVDSGPDAYRPPERCHKCHYEFSGESKLDEYHRPDKRGQVNLPIKRTQLGRPADFSGGYVVWCDRCYLENAKQATP